MVNYHYLQLFLPLNSLYVLDTLHNSHYSQLQPFENAYEYVQY